MPPSDTRSNGTFQETMRKVRPSVAFVVMIFGALIAFEIFNYSTTEHALGDLLGSLTFAGLRWSTVLALAFCGIDFAGIARLFTPEQGMNEPKEVWYLFGAWLLAATMNAILTWWGVSIAVAGHVAASSAVVDQGTINSVVPIFVAIMVWVIRILIIGTLSLSMDRLIHPGAEQHVPIQDAFSHRPAQVNRAKAQPTQPMNIPMSASGSNSGSRAAHASGSGISGGSNARPAVRGVSASSASRFGLQAAEDDDFTQDGMAPRNGRPDPTYHSLSMSGRPPANRPANTPSNENTGRFRRS
jgi:hypothetical protein